MANRTTRAQIDDVSSSYFLHPSDGPGLVLVSQALSEDNFASWSRAMILSLTVKNKLGFVDGSIVEPPEDDPILHHAWVRNNGMVMSWILNAISKDIQASVMYSKTAREIWTDLNVRFSQTNGPRIFQLRRELANLRQEQFSVNVYFTKLKAIWDELVNFRPNCTCGLLVDYYNQEQVMAFLMGLNESFSQTRGQILLMDPLPHINKVFALVSQEERQRSVGQSFEGHSSLSFAVRGAPVSYNPRPSAPSAPVSQNNQYYPAGDKKHTRGFCTHCNKYGHTMEKCYKIHGFPPGYQSSGFKPRPRMAAPSGRFGINQVSSSNSHLDIQGEASSSLENSAMTAAQCQQILAYVSQQMAQQSGLVPSSSSAVPAQDDSHISCVTGQVDASDWYG